ncbi:MAG: PTS sugar transporter subunit IIA [bacterium]|nr:PTS sugar transporter subunit IIA [bacterium]
MKVVEVIRDGGIIKWIKGKKKKQDAIKELVSALADKYDFDKDEVIEGVLAREEVMSTGLGQGVAIPHTKAKSVTKAMLAICQCEGGIEFNSIDGKPVHLVFLLVVPQEASNFQIKILARISRLLKHNYIRERLNLLKTPEEVMEFISEEEEKHLPLP